jgi:hypothetical protein
VQPPGFLKSGPDPWDFLYDRGGCFSQAGWAAVSGNCQASYPTYVFWKRSTGRTHVLGNLQTLSYYLCNLTLSSVEVKEGGAISPLPHMF